MGRGMIQKMKTFCYVFNVIVLVHKGLLLLLTQNSSKYGAFLHTFWVSVAAVLKTCNLAFYFCSPFKCTFRLEMSKFIAEAFLEKTGWMIRRQIVSWLNIKMTCKISRKICSSSPPPLPTNPIFNSSSPPWGSYCTWFAQILNFRPNLRTPFVNLKRTTNIFIANRKIREKKCQPNNSFFLTLQYGE